VDLTAVRDTVLSYGRYAQVVARAINGQRTYDRGKHLLILAWSFPPSVESGVYRPAALARYAIARNWQVSAISGPAPKEPCCAGRHLADYVGEKVRRFAIEPSELRPSHKTFPRIDGGFIEALDTVDLALSALSNNPPSVVLASGPPFHNFVAAHYIGRSFGIPYVLDYRDEWTQCPFNFVKVGNADPFYERACLQSARFVIFTTESQRRHQLAAFPELDAGRCRVIENGWEAADANGCAPPFALPPAPLRIAFIGTAAPHSLPAPFLGVLERVLENDHRLQSELRLMFVGRRTAWAQEQLARFRFPQVLELHDAVSRPQAFALMRQVDGLLLFNEPRLHRYRPGKLYSYLAMKTPILVLGAEGEVAQLVDQLCAGRVVPADNPAALASALRELPGLRSRLNSHCLDAWLREHTRERLSEKFLDLLDPILSE